MTIATTWENLEYLISAQRVQTVLLQFTDVVGRMKGVSLPADRFIQIGDHGQWIDGSSLESAVRLREFDMHLRPDPATFAVLPWTEGGAAVARVICDVIAVDRRPSPADPRQALRRAVAAAEGQGLHLQVAPELEFYICQRQGDGQLAPLSGERQGYFDLGTDPGTELRHAIVAGLRQMGMTVESSHHEVSPGQHEIDLAPLPLLAAADALATIKIVAHHLARAADLTVTFMPKPFNGLSGSGLHMHQLAQSAEGQNLFVEQGRRGVSELGQWFIAGQLRHAAACAVLTMPLVNSYKRLAGGFEAPATVSWAHENRSAFIRIPNVPADHPQAGRIEVRGGDPACNPYLALAALTQAGVAGVLAREAPPPPVEDPVYPFEDRERIPLGSTPLPTSLGEALTAFVASPLMQETLGEMIFSRYAELKRREWRAFQAHVTDWERDTALEIA